MRKAIRSRAKEKGGMIEINIKILHANGCGGFFLLKVVRTYAYAC